MKKKYIYKNSVLETEKDLTDRCSVVALVIGNFKGLLSERERVSVFV